MPINYIQNTIGLGYNKPRPIQCNAIQIVNIIQYKITDITMQ